MLYFSFTLLTHTFGCPGHASVKSSPVDYVREVGFLELFILCAGATPALGLFNTAAVYVIFMCEMRQYRVERVDRSP